MADALPHFRFHPDPLQSGAIEPSTEPCGVCGQVRGFVYTGNCYVEDEFDAELCPWCIADGSAHRKFGVTFNEIVLAADVDEATADEIEERTPGLTCFNPVDWPRCCGAPMAYLEPAGHAEIVARHPQLQSVLVPQMAAEMRVPTGEAMRVFRSLRRDESPCAHVFRCPTCQTLRAEIDFD